MPAKRTYNIKGTNDFLVLGLIFFFLCLWAVKDAWYPSDKVLKKHPRTVVASFESAGSIEKVFLNVDDSVAEEQVIASLRTDKMAVEYEEAKNRFTENKNNHAAKVSLLKNAKTSNASEQEVSDIKEQINMEKKAMDEALAEVTRLRAAMDSSELKSPVKGKILEVKVATHSMVDAGDAVVIIDPKDHFYAFNKSLAIFSFFAFWVFLGIHIFAR